MIIPTDDETETINKKNNPCTAPRQPGTKYDTKNREGCPDWRSEHERWVNTVLPTLAFFYMPLRFAIVAMMGTDGIASHGTGLFIYGIFLSFSRCLAYLLFVLILARRAKTSAVAMICHILSCIWLLFSIAVTVWSLNAMTLV